MHWVIAVIFGASLLAGCGSSTSTSTGSDSVIHPATVPATTNSTAPVANAKDLVLGVSDIGYGWLTVDSHTRSVGLKETMKGDPASIRPLERKAFRSAYEALYANADHQGVFSEVSVFDTGAHARAIATVWKSMVPAKTHTTPAATPAGAPGTGFALFKGTTQEDGTSVPLYLGTWVQGNAVVAVMAFGPGVTTDTLMKLAKKQDAKTKSRSPTSAA